MCDLTIGGPTWFSHGVIVCLPNNFLFDSSSTMVDKAPQYEIQSSCTERTCPCELCEQISCSWINVTEKILVQGDKGTIVWSMEQIWGVSNCKENIQPTY